MRIPGCLVVCCMVGSLHAQQKRVVMGKLPNAYVIHTLASKETLTAIGLQYGTTAQQLAEFNGMNINLAAALQKGTAIRIPLSSSNFSQEAGSRDQEPVYHIVGKGENLFRVAQAYNKLSLSVLREWNNLKSDAVKNGQVLVVGHLRTKMRTTASEKISKPLMATAKPLTTASGTPPVLPKESIVKETILTTPRNEEEGFFVTAFVAEDSAVAPQIRKGEAATFKTISGWMDRKYYVLINHIAPGTVVRITASNQKSICAKVLGPLPDSASAPGIFLRMSNSAAAVLEMNETKFFVALSYFE